MEEIREKISAMIRTIAKQSEGLTDEELEDLINDVFTTNKVNNGKD